MISTLLLVQVAFSLPQQPKFRLKTEWTDEVLQNPSSVLPEYPRPQLMRDDQSWRNLNGYWQFGLNEIELDQQILVPFPVESALSGVGRSVGSRFVYRRTFKSEWSTGKTLLNFGACDYECSVKVNGQLVGTHQGGYTSFSFDITPYLAKVDNELVLSVYDPTDLEGVNQPTGKQRAIPNGIFYTSASGIWQTVWLEHVNEVSVETIKITPNIVDSTVGLQVKLRGSGHQNMKLIISLQGADQVFNLSELIQIKVKEQMLWTPDNPYLYQFRLKLEQDGRIIDTVNSYFAMRSVEVKVVDGKQLLSLNGNPIFQYGLLDQGYWPDGIYTAPTDEALKSDLVKSKDLGLNMVRKHIKVEPARWFYHADTLGLLVWQDIPSMNTLPEYTDQMKQRYEKEMLEIMAQLYNYPSIAVWVVFNEAWGQYETKRVSNLAIRADPTRLVNCASGWNWAPVGNFVDIHHYVEPSMESRSGYVSALGEFGGIGLIETDHLWSDKPFSYELQPTKVATQQRYLGLMATLKELKKKGLSAAVYTELTDVENEVNGLWTYDRKDFKMVDIALLKRVHQELISGSTTLAIQKL